jgi:2-dehydropantoate 2-reductase
VCKSVEDAADTQYSYVVVTTKAIPELTKTPEILSPFLSASYNAKFRQPTYVMMQNGLNVEADLFNALTQLQIDGVIKEVPRIIGVAAWICTNLREPNVVDHGDFVSIIVLQ